MLTISQNSQDNLIFARKPTIAENYTENNELSEHNKLTQTDPYSPNEISNQDNNATKLTKSNHYNIEFIVNNSSGAPVTKNDKNEIKKNDFKTESQSDFFERVGIGNSKYRKVSTINHTKNNEEITLVNILGLNDDFKKCDNSIIKGGGLNGDKDFFHSYNFTDPSSQVKHGCTPVNDPSQQSPSPQLPAPSPNYPTLSVSNIESSNVPKEILKTESCTNNSQISINENEKIVREEPLENAKIDNGCKVKTVELSSLIKKNFQCTVLNVPNYCGMPQKRKKISKIDKATFKRKLRRQKKVGRLKVSDKLFEKKYEKVEQYFGVSIYGNSDSSSSSSEYSSSDCEDLNLDTWIKSGPPLKPCYMPNKVCFLQIFGLTTHMEKNIVEVKKMERRKWQQICFDFDQNDEKKIAPLSLPVPLTPASVLNFTPDYKNKTNFLQSLGLNTVPAHKREEMDNIWMKIVTERLRRNGKSPLTCYSLLCNRKKSFLIDNKSDLLLTNTIDNNNIYFNEFKIPIVHQFTNFLQYIKKEREEYNPFPLENIDKKRPLSISTDFNASNKWVTVPNYKATIPIKNDFPIEKPPKWMGMQAVVNSYQIYSKEREEEIQSLKKHTTILRDEIKSKQSKSRHLERKQREINSSLFLMNQEKRRLQKEIDQLMKIVNAFR